MAAGPLETYLPALRKEEGGAGSRGLVGPFMAFSLHNISYQTLTSGAHRTAQIHLIYEEMKLNLSKYVNKSSSIFLHPAGSLFGS
jgi:hypothetical protein